MIDIINDYEVLQKNFGKLLEKSGYRLDHLAKEIGMSREYFYVKKQRGNFSHEQMKRLLNIIWKPEMEDLLFGEILKKYDIKEITLQKMKSKQRLREISCCR